MGVTLGFDVGTWLVVMLSNNLEYGMIWTAQNLKIHAVFWDTPNSVKVEKWTSLSAKYKEQPKTQ